jgi:hypothetical protein
MIAINKKLKTSGHGLEYLQSNFFGFQSVISLHDFVQ